MTLRLGLLGLDSSHAEDFLRHFNDEARHPEMRIVSIHGGDDARVRELLAIDRSLAPAETIEQLIAWVDAVIVGDRDGGRHLAHALPCLEAGRAVFVDKPLANRRADGERMVAAARRAGVPLLSGSALRWQAETRRLRAAIVAAGEAVELLAYGTWYPNSEYGGPIFYASHAIELAQELLGPSFADVLLSPGDTPVVHYRCGVHSVSLAFRPPGNAGDAAFGVEVDGPTLRLWQPIPLGDDYMLPVVDEIAAMLSSDRSPLTAEALLAPLALMEEIGALLAR